MGPRPMPHGLECPSCGRTYLPEERFCGSCGTPLVHGEGAPLDLAPTARQERARKIKPQLAEGELVYVVGASNLAEGEFIQGLLLEEGVPSLLRRSRGFDVPDFLAAGPRDVLVPESGLETAREVLLQADLLPADGARRVVTPPGRLLAGLLVGVALVFVIVWLGTTVLR